MILNTWQRNAVRVFFSLGLIYVCFAIYMLFKSGQVDAIYKSLFVIVISLVFPFIALLESIYAAIVFVLFALVIFVGGKKISEKYLTLFIVIISIAWIIYGYICMMVITGGA
jgi:hypothetical protein